MTAKRIDPERARELLDGGGYVYLDVRTPEEFAQGHVPRARNVPFMVRGPGGAGMFFNPQFVSTVESSFNKDTKLIVGCQKGGRSNKASELLVDKGFANVFDMRGGYIGETDPFGKVTFPGWCAKGYPTSTNESAAEERQRTPVANKA